MSKKSARPIGPLAETQCDIDTREAPRYSCSDRPVLRVMVRPNFVALCVGVRDISMKGIGLLCDSAIPPGARLALLWEFGHPRQWRTLQARVARATASPRGGWVVGCTFDEWLQPDDLDAFFLSSPRSGRIGRNR